MNPQIINTVNKKQCVTNIRLATEADSPIPHIASKPKHARIEMVITRMSKLNIKIILLEL
jgi:hypothetical protein